MNSNSRGVDVRRFPRSAAVLAAFVALSAVGGAVAAPHRGAADLTVLNVQPRPHVAPGARFDGVDSTKNAGGTDAGSSVTAYFLATKPYRGPLDERLGERAVPPLPAHAVSRGRVSLELPAGTGGEYHLLACADDGDDVAEVAASNNCRAAPAKLFAGTVPRGRLRDASAPGAPSVTITTTGAAAATETALYFRPGAAGTATITARVADAESGVNHVAFPALGAGWSAGGEDPAPPYAARYAFGPTAAAPRTTPFVRAVNGVGLTSATQLAVVADSTAPAIAVRCDRETCSSSWYTGVVLVELEASDEQSGAGEIRYTIDGTDPSRANGILYSGPISIARTTTLAFRAYDRVGNESESRAQLVRVDTTPPSPPALAVDAGEGTSVEGTTLYFRSGSAGGFSVTAATDDPESGVARVEFGPLGAGWTGGGSATSAPYAATYAFGSDAEGGLATVNAINGAGLETSAALTVEPDAAAPSLGFRCDGAPCSSARYAAPVALTLDVADARSGVGTVRYTTDGSMPSRTNGALYTGPLTLPLTTTVKAIAYDRVGNESLVETVQVSIGIEPDPVPLALSPVLDDARSVTTTVTAAEGGSVVTEGADGTLYILSIPSGAIANDVEVTMTPITAIGGLPLSRGLSAGVDLKPDGLRFVKPAQLIMFPARVDSALETVGFVYDGDGENFRLHPYQRLTSPWDGRTRVVFKLNHFTGAGAGATTPDDLAALGANLPPEAEARLEHVGALLAKESQCQAAGTSCVSEARLREAIASALRAWYSEVSAKVSGAASGEIAALQDAFSAATAWERTVQLLGASSPEFDAMWAELEAGIRTALTAAKTLQASRCRSGDFSSIPKLYALARFEALTGTPDGNLDLDTVIGACLVFEVRIDSTLSRTRTPLEQTLQDEVRAVATFKFRLRGGYDFGSLTPANVTFETWEAQYVENGAVVNCSLAQSDAKLRFTVGFNMSPESGARDVRIDRVSMNIPTSRGTHQWVETSTCGSNAFNIWLNGWKRWHADEAEPEPTFGTPHTFTITTLDQATATGARKTYERSRQTSSQVEEREQTTLTVVHAPE